MNILEYQMIDVLKQLRDEYGVFEIKAEFEAEGSRIEEMMRLKDVTSKVQLPIILKIGGVEAITDIYNALSIGVKGIIAPMAETAFAVSKFLNAVETFVAEDNRADIDFAINIETITAYNNINDILSLNNIDILHGLTIGRVDFVGSMGHDRGKVDSEEIYNYCHTIFSKARQKGLKTGLGGAISTCSIDFIRNLHAEGLVDKFETRKVVFRADTIKNDPEKAILKAVEFELLWLKSKRRYYHRIKSEDEHRIEMLDKRLGLQ
ncbi:MAG: citrate lyase beta subunit [Chlorobaculum sp.]|jgi:2-keto-3-deoxy-L-rhamnonate aldolase RhmA|nr:citrate lyase beta subunit [Chlorobaculum sp.]